MTKFKLCAMLLAICAVGAYASPTFQFAAGVGGYTYTPNGPQGGKLTFNQVVVVTKGDNSMDPVQGQVVNLPNMKLRASGNGEFKLTPQNGGKFSITDATGKTTFLTGTLGTGNFVPTGTSAGAFTVFQSDITSIQISNKINSEALKRVQDLGKNARLDLNLALNGHSDFTTLIKSKGTASDGFSGSASVIPAPGAILLGSVGVGIVGWLRRRRTL